MSNLSELLPAGAGAKSASFVASGTLGSGVTVALKSDGTVEAVKETTTPTGAGTPVVFESATTLETATTFDPVEQKVVVFYKDNGNSNYGTAIVGTVTGSSISFGTPVIFESASAQDSQAVYDSVSGKHVVCFNGIYGYTKVGTVSGNSISFGTRTQLINRSISEISLAADITSGRILFFYQEATFGYTQYSVGTISGTSISVGTSTTYSGNGLAGSAAVYDESIGKVIFLYSENPSNNLYGRVCTVSGTSLSFGSTASFGYGAGGRLTAAYDSANEKTVVFYGNVSGHIGCKVATASGTSLSIGSEVTFTTDNVIPKATYNSTSGKIVVAYQNYSNSGYGTFRVGTVSGTSISFGSAIIFESASSDEMSIASSSSSGATIVSYQDEGNSNYGTSAVLTIVNTTTNSADFIGITDQAIADTATGAVIVQGGVSDKVTGLTTGSDYYVQSNGSLSTTASSVPAGRALSSTSILLEG
mgnify:CR=1 FL=1